MTEQSKDEAAVFYCAQKLQGGNGQDLKKNNYQQSLAMKYKQIDIPEILYTMHSIILACLQHYFKAFI